MYCISIVIGLIFYLLLMGSIIYKIQNTDDQSEKAFTKAFVWQFTNSDLGIYIFMIFT